MIVPWFIITCLALCTNGSKLHEYMTKEEIESNFNIDHNLVDGLEYEVTSLHHVEQPDSKEQKVRRSRSTVQFTAFDRSVSLDLLENDNTLLGSATPLYIATGGPHNIQYERRTFPMPDNLKLYHNVRKRAAISVFTDENNKTHVSGTIGDEYTIRPIPALLQKRMIQGEIPLDQGTLELLSHVCTRANLNDPEIRTCYMNHDTYKHCYDPNLHFVIKTGPQVNSPTYPTGPSSNNPSSNQRPSWRPSPITPQQSWSGVPNSQDIMYPKVLVSVDYETFVNHGRDINKLSKYMASFWNSVDLRFRELRQPQVRLNIAGLIIPMFRDSASHFERAYINYDTLDANVVLQEMQNNLAEATQQKQLDKSTYDVAVCITSRQLLYRKDGLVARPNDKALGLARLGSACWDSAVAVLTDKGNFNGMSTAAHELGHVFNAVHDGYETNNSPVGPCPTSDGYLMSTENAINDNGFHWSECSKRAMKEFFARPQALCMRNRPYVGTPYPKLLPGKILSREEQCLSLGNNFYPNTDEDHNCLKLWCQERGTLSSRPITPAEGSSCGPRSVCLAGQCVRDPTN